MPLPILPVRSETLERLARRIWRRARGPVQRMATGTLSRLGQRWPTLADLVAGIVGTGVASPAPAPGPRATPMDDAEEVVAGAQHIVALQSSRDFRARQEAARTLARVPNAESTAALVAALRDTSAEVAIAAVEALATGTRDGALPALRAVVSNADHFHDALVRAAAVRALGQHGAREDDELLHAAMRDVDAEVSVSAIAAIAERDGQRDADALLSLLQDGTRFFLPLTRLTAARALGRLSTVRDEAVRSLLENERDIEVRTALQALVQPAQDTSEAE